MVYQMQQFAQLRKNYSNVIKNIVKSLFFLGVPGKVIENNETVLSRRGVLGIRQKQMMI